MKVDDRFSILQADQLFIRITSIKPIDHPVAKQQLQLRGCRTIISSISCASDSYRVLAS